MINTICCAFETLDEFGIRLLPHYYPISDWTREIGKSIGLKFGNLTEWRVYIIRCRCIIMQKTDLGENRKKTTVLFLL